MIGALASRAASSARYSQLRQQRPGVEDSTGDDGGGGGDLCDVSQGPCLVYLGH